MSFLLHKFLERRDFKINCRECGSATQLHEHAMVMSKLDARIGCLLITHNIRNNIEFLGAFERTHANGISCQRARCRGHPLETYLTPHLERLMVSVAAFGFERKDWHRFPVFSLQSLTNTRYEASTTNNTQNCTWCSVAKDLLLFQLSNNGGVTMKNFWVIKGMNQIGILMLLHQFLCSLMCLTPFVSVQLDIGTILLPHNPNYVLWGLLGYHDCCFHSQLLC
mmetsp:Transcript_6047/g.22871  ORF Transcript_6047/g.22871 Transcript_6047/m.22871 type:complete len:223 (+) Transcript_6047:1529-2197(+)